jgi:LuxR family transcriptional regulator, maltose regulon positive regulatory protein
MARRNTPSIVVKRSSGRRPSASVPAARFIPPRLDPRIIRRVDLFSRVRNADEPVIDVVAPAGYGKTTLLVQLFQEVSDRAAWLTLASEHDDPQILLRDVCEALVRAGDPAAIMTLGSPADIDAVLFQWQRSDLGPPVLFLDRLETVRSGRSSEVIVQLATSLPQGARLVVAGRRALPVAEARLQAEGHLRVFGPRDLALDQAQTGKVLAASGVHRSVDEVATVWTRTAGWPAGVRLAATWLRGDPRHRADELTGRTPLIADYLRDEVLARCRPKDVQALLRTSVLERLSPSLCDAVLGTADAGRTLDRLRASNAMLFPDDDGATWHRYHPLFREMLREELDRQDENAAAQLLPRAAAWSEDHDDPAAAVRYASGTDDVDRVLRIAAGHTQRFFQTGRGEVAVGWFDWLLPRLPASAFGSAAALAAVANALVGRPTEVDRWLETATRQALTGDADSNLAPMVALTRSLLSRQGPAQMDADASEAMEGLAPADPWWSIALALHGIALFLAGHGAEADDVLADAQAQTAHVDATNAAVVTMSQRAFIAIRVGDHVAAESLSRQTAELRDASGIDKYATSALTYAIAARIAIWHANLPLARRELARAQRLRPALTYAIPWLAVETLLEMTHVAIALADAAGARALIREIDAITHRRPDLGVLVSEIDEVGREVRDIRPGVPGATALTTAEMRLLPLLQTHLSFPEIARSLHLSKHTVKTQAISIYRKLGTTSRSETITRATALGLVD